MVGAAPRSREQCVYRFAYADGETGCFLPGCCVRRVAAAGAVLGSRTLRVRRAQVRSLAASASCGNGGTCIRCFHQRPCAVAMGWRDGWPVAVGSCPPAGRMGARAAGFGAHCCVAESFGPPHFDSYRRPPSAVPPSDASRFRSLWHDLKSYKTFVHAMGNFLQLYRHGRQAHGAR